MIAVSRYAVDVAKRCIKGIERAHGTLAVAESLTGGAVAATIVSVPGASRVFRGGVVTYAIDTKIQVLGIESDMLMRTGPVDPTVATQMACNVAQLYGANYALATTGVAGPGSADGFPAGTVWIGVVTPQGSDARLYHFDGDRDDVRVATVEAALEWLEELTANYQVNMGTLQG